MIYKYIVFIFLVFISLDCFSQTINEAAARAEIEKRGYDADRFKQEMINKGVNPDSINPENPVDVARAKKAAEEVMAILDAEKKAKTTKPTQKDPEEIKTQVIKQPQSKNG
ncbi:MAG: hypothetical protein IPO92_14900 [Saprospiraceae bacterium]|nr:hypothetical protein [Saprospiraceae bacterium]